MFCTEWVKEIDLADCIRTNLCLLCAIFDLTKFYVIYTFLPRNALGPEENKNKQKKQYCVLLPTTGCGPCFCCTPPQASDMTKTCPLKAGHTGATC